MFRLVVMCTTEGVGAINSQVYRSSPFHVPQSRSASFESIGRWSFARLGRCDGKSKSRALGSLTGRQAQIQTKGFLHVRSKKLGQEIDHMSRYQYVFGKTNSQCEILWIATLDQGQLMRSFTIKYRRNQQCGNPTNTLLLVRAMS